MEAHELLEKYKDGAKTQLEYEEIVDWCANQSEHFDYANDNQRQLFEMATKYLMKYKVGKLNQNDAIILTQYLSNKTAKELGISEKITTKVIAGDEYNRDDSAVCFDKGNGKSEIQYSQKVLEHLTSNNKDRILRGLQAISHEVVHAKQNARMALTIEDAKANSDLWIMTIEKTCSKANSVFYNKNYEHLFRENQAEKMGLTFALKQIKEYNSKLYKMYNQEQLLEKMSKYEKNFFDSKLIMDGKEFDPLLQEDTICSEYIMNNPEYLKEYPVLQLGFNSDGTKKDIIQILEDRKQMIEMGRTVDVVNGLYNTIIRHRNVSQSGLNGHMDEIKKLDNYIKENGIEDQFVFDLLRFKLENKTKATPEQVENFIKEAQKMSAKTRQERNEKEKEHEETESIKDEIGDEFKSKTEQQEQEEQQVETMWQNRFQSWDRDSVNLPNSAKRKEEAVQIMKNIDKEKELEEQRKLQELKEQEEMEGRR